MTYLLDTCALLHLVNDGALLPEAARRAIEDESATLYVSVLSAAELSIKAGKGRLMLPMPVSEWIQKAIELHHLTLLTLDLVPCATAGQLPWHHSDPFDRLLIATALHLKMPIITSDQTMPNYPGVQVIWK